MIFGTWAREIHQNAVEHGFYDGGARPFPEILALCHSELSEALEEYRNGSPMEYKGEGGKPEGIAVEMADCLIRILDWFGYAGVDVDRIILEKHTYNRTRPYMHGKPGTGPRTIEEHAKRANKTLAEIMAEIDAMEYGVIPDMNEPMYRKAPPFNPIPLTDGKTPAEVAMEMREWGKIGDRPIVRYEEVNPALAHALYIGGVPVEKGTGMCWTQIPWEKDGNNCPYEWFVNEAKYGAKYRKRVNSDDENCSPG